MFNLFSKKTLPKGDTVVLKIVDMHCTNCAITIDGALEETPGVIEATTSYARGKTTVVFDAAQVSIEQLQHIIEEQGYSTEKVLS